MYNVSLLKHEDVFVKWSFDINSNASMNTSKMTKLIFLFRYYFFFAIPVTVASFFFSCVTLDCPLDVKKDRRVLEERYIKQGVIFHVYEFVFLSMCGEWLQD